MKFSIHAGSIRTCAQAAMPYGIEAFDTVLRPLWKGPLAAPVLAKESYPYDWEPYMMHLGKL